MVYHDICMAQIWSSLTSAHFDFRQRVFHAKLHSLAKQNLYGKQRRSHRHISTTEKQESETCES